MTSSPLWRGGGKIFPNSPNENFSHKVNRKMYRAGMASILSQLTARTAFAWSTNSRSTRPRPSLAQKVKAMGFDEVLVLTEEVDQNLLLSSRNLENVQVMSVRNANPVALVRCAKVLLTKGALARLEELKVKKYNIDQLMNIVLAPVVSEKSTFVADKNRQYVFRVADDATKPRSRRRSSSCSRPRSTRSRCRTSRARNGASAVPSGRKRNWKRPTCA